MKRTLFPVGQTQTNGQYTDGTPVKDFKLQRLQDEIEGTVNELVGCLGENHAEIFFLHNTDKETPAVVLVLTGKAAKFFGPGVEGVVESIKELIEQI